MNFAVHDPISYLILHYPQQLLASIYFLHGLFYELYLIHHYLLYFLLSRHILEYTGFCDHWPLSFVLKRGTPWKCTVGGVAEASCFIESFFSLLLRMRFSTQSAVVNCLFQAVLQVEETGLDLMSLGLLHLCLDSPLKLYIELHPHQPLPVLFSKFPILLILSNCQLDIRSTPKLFRSNPIPQVLTHRLFNERFHQTQSPRHLIIYQF